MMKTSLALATAAIGYGVLTFNYQSAPKIGAYDPFAKFRIKRTSKVDLKQALRKVKQSMSGAVAHAADDPQAPIDYLRAGVGFAIGYSDQGYVDYVCNGTEPAAGEECDGPPKKGLVGTFLDIGNGISDVVTAAGYASCTDIPSSGTAEGTVDSQDVTLTFGVPSLKVPSGYEGAGSTFDK
ncbi:MAG: hypothetical protein EBX52_14420, partial [Proteobacteria bacterium]|nr:hypothetical protein [Pseudomonadota bacterium]